LDPVLPVLFAMQSHNSRLFFDQIVRLEN